MASPRKSPLSEPGDRQPTAAIVVQPSSPRYLPSGTPTCGAQRRIGIAVDLSDESAFAVKWAVQNYLRPGDAVILLHVRPTSVLYGADWGATDVSIPEDQSSAPVVQGLSWNFYDSSCPKVDDIVRKQLKKVFKADIGQAAGLLRLHFHDCFVQDCDGSMLLEGSASGPSEQDDLQSPNSQAKRSRVIELSRRLKHRSPDWSGLHCHGNCYQQLAIVDPASGDQPLYSEDKIIVVTIDGEIYNHKQLRENLKSHQFRTGSDCDVITHLYEEHGEEFVHMLDGMFSFVLLDTRDQSFISARDAIGTLHGLES